jgi:argininosuccinate lyase
MAVTLEKRGAPSYVRTPAWRFLASLPVDRRLAKYDLAGSIAHVEMLGSTGIVTEEEAHALVLGLRKVWSEVRDGAFPWRDDLEDVHTNVEVRLTEMLGPLGAKVHTARSRNDQIALDERLFLREAAHAVQERAFRLQLALMEQAERHLETILPGYTHLQRAQPVTLAHHLLAHFWRLSRDFDRLTSCTKGANVSPLGAGALAGSTLPSDPAYVAHRLGFPATFENSLDAVSDRDYFAEFLFDLTLLAVHLSSIGEELVLWSSSEFGFVRPTAELGSGSSLMPQKRNPDVAELARGKAARVLGYLTGLLAALKSLPLAYNRDLQEDKALVFDGATQVLETLEALAAAIPALEFDEDRMAKAAEDPRLLATDLAEFLVQNGVPFREAHETVAAVYAANPKVDAKALKAAHPKFGDVEDLLDVRRAVDRRRTPGGPAPKALIAQLAKARDTLGLEQYSLSKHAESVRIIDDILEASK